MHWTRNPHDDAIFELIDEARGGPPLARLGFINADRAVCELAPERRLVFVYMSDPKSVRVVDGQTNQTLGVISLSWKDSGTLNLGGEKIEWEYTGIFAKSRQWVDASGKVLVHIDAIALPKPTAVKLGAASQATPLLVALGWFLKLRCDWTPPDAFVAPGGAFAWAMPKPTLTWIESEHPEAQFELRYGSGEPLAQLTVMNETTGAGAVKRFGGATEEEGKWILELAKPASGIRRVEVSNADTKAIVATMDVDAVYAGHLLVGDARYSWSRVANEARTWSFTGPDGKQILELGELTIDDVDLDLELAGDHPRVVPRVSGHLPARDEVRRRRHAAPRRLARVGERSGRRRRRHELGLDGKDDRRSRRRRKRDLRSARLRSKGCSMERRDGNRRVADLVRQFTRAHFASHPEDASTLGVAGHSGQLSSPSREAAARDLVGLRAALAEASSIEAERASGHTELDLDAALDLDALRRAARFHARRIETDAGAESLETAALPNAALQHAALHARSIADLDNMIERALAVPGYLEQQTENLRRGVKEGRAADREVAETFVARLLPGAARSIGTLPTDVARRLAPLADAAKPAALRRLADATAKASDAYRAMARAVSEDILPQGRRDVVLGADEVAFRLRDVMGVETSIDALLAAAEERLARAHTEMVEHAAIAGHANVTRAEDTKDALNALFGKKAQTIEEAVAAYDTQLAAATRFARERAIVHIPDDLAIALEPLPDGIADGSGLTNWPAPLLEPTGRGHALYSLDPRDHPIISSKQLAIHEGIPGHYLQSAVWQRGSLNPVRFLGVMDDVAMSVGYFGTMVSVEGWAVHMEDVMVREGFFEAGNERLFSAWCDAVRATRVLLDLGLHALGKSADEMTSRVARATLLSEDWARRQVLRSKRIPLQSSTYLIGAMEIESLSALARPKQTALEFHRELLSFGPVPTSRLRDHWLS